MVQKLEYNGYTNYETWNCALWLNNDQYTQEQLSDKALELVEEIDVHNADDIERIQQEMADFIATMVDDMQENMGFHIEASMFADMLNAALREIDYRDIARSELADALYEAAKKGAA